MKTCNIHAKTSCTRRLKRNNVNKLNHQKKHMKSKTKTINLCGVQMSTEMGSNLFVCLIFLSRFVSDTITTRFGCCYSLLLYNVNLLRFKTQLYYFPLPFPMCVIFFLNLNYCFSKPLIMNQNSVSISFWFRFRSRKKWLFTWSKV